MSDYSELKRLAEHHLSLGQAYTVAKPSVLLALIADNERLTAAIGSQAIRRFVGQDDQKKMDELVSAGIQVDKDRIAQLEAERDQLKAENERLERKNANQSESIREYQDLVMGGDVSLGMLKADIRVTTGERDQLRAEVAGLKTGYEAYERVNAELRAEVEGLRKALTSSREFLMRDAKVRRMTDGARHISPMFPLRKLVMEQIDAALGQGEQP